MAGCAAPSHPRPQRPASTPTGPAAATAPPDHAGRGHAEEDDDDLLLLDGDYLDLEQPLRDAVVLALPLAPLCRDDCPGLCPECGARLADDPAHSHDATDPRWAALAGLVQGSAEGTSTTSQTSRTSQNRPEKQEN